MGGSIKSVINTKDAIWFGRGGGHVGENDISGDRCSGNSGSGVLPRGECELRDSCIRRDIKET
jgi:hypothetical protein